MNITLTQKGDILSGTISIFRSEDIYISSAIYRSCNGSIGISTKWSILMCNSSCVTLVTLPSSIDMSSSELFIPARLLDYGKYEFTLTVTVNGGLGGNQSSSTQIEVKRSSISPKLVSLGTSMISHSVLTDLKMDPGSYSTDPDSLIFDGNVRYSSENQCL